jgi:hypothetical protein
MPLPNSNIDVGSGTVGVGVGEKQLTQNGVIPTLGEGVGAQPPETQNGVISTLGLGEGVVMHSGHVLLWCEHTPVTQTSGINARKGHSGIPPAAAISPQSQIVPSTESCVKTCTLLCGCCAVTSMPDVRSPVAACVAEVVDMLAVKGPPAIAGVTAPVDDVDGF